MPLNRWMVRQWDFVRPEKHPFITMSEEAAKYKTEMILKHWTLDVLEHQIKIWELFGPKQRGMHSEFVKEGKILVEQMTEDLDAGLVWRAYHRLKEFERNFENDFPNFGIVGVIGGLEVTPEPEPE